ncbi:MULTISPECIES: phenylpyruvate tautomerase MIF-related protein [Clostridium]|uniref:Tautomerase family protein n=1 Tax=Clostridium cibarium TaxID=2762247 RepID=A0ABR8PTP8_9CLOT|nr:MULTISPECIES: phenylpyruvate tautomerase MIF-related protein [Clostridium]MBD7911537.1 tautomerase family protein [Clostridium cibarium]
MPYIDSKVTIPLSENEKEYLKKELGKIVNDIPGKSEKFLMLGFQDNYSLYFKGQKMDYGAFVEVKLFGRVSEDSLKRVTKEICDLYNDKLNIPPRSIYVKFEEVDTWGWNGSNL